MQVFKPKPGKKLLGFTFKLLSTASLWIGTAILTKLQLAPNANNWQATLEQFPLWALIVLILLFPIAWLLVEFLATCFIEVRARMLDHAAPRFAQWLTEFPNAVGEVLARWGDSGSACLGRWRFDGRYRARIAEECQHLHTQTGPLHATAGFSLERAYTELNVASTQYGDVDPSLLASRIRGRENVYSFLRMQQPGTALAILGRPGGGKTTLLRHLALLYAQGKQGRYRLRRRMPILIELRRVTDLFTDKVRGEWKSPTLIQVIQHYWKHHSALGGIMTKAPPDWLKRHLASGRALVMVDGLDEVPHRLNPENPNHLTPRQRVSQWLEAEMQREVQRDCLFLVTSRPGGFAEAPLTHRVSMVEVQPLTIEQSERFIYAFHYGCLRSAHPIAKTSQLESDAAKATEQLQQELRSKPHLSDLRVNPLLLHMVCLLHHLRGRLPADRSDLYKETCDVLLNRDLRAPGIQERLRPQDKLAALRPLAAYFMRSGSPEAKSTDELLPIIQPVFNTLSFPAKEFFDYVSKDSGLLQEVEHRRWDFAHKTFYEYLTAEHWEKHPPSPGELAEWVDQDWWRVALLFYSARSEDSPVISAALASRKPKAWSLAFACLAAEHRINAEEREKAKCKLSNALSHPNDQTAFIPAAQALLDLSMRETVAASSDGMWLRRNSLVTQAEYQLFLLCHPPAERYFLVPPHWSTDRFSGDPIAPIVGVTFSQAEIFAKWASKEQAWQTPTVLNDSTYLVDGCWVAPGPHSDTSAAQITDKTRQIRDRIVLWANENSLTHGNEATWEDYSNVLERYCFRRGAVPLRRIVVNTFATLLRLLSRMVYNRSYGPAEMELGAAIESGILEGLSIARKGREHFQSANPAMHHEYGLAERRLRFAHFKDLGSALCAALHLDPGRLDYGSGVLPIRLRETAPCSDVTYGKILRLLQVIADADSHYDNLAAILRRNELDPREFKRCIHEIRDKLPSTDEFEANRRRLLLSAGRVIVTISSLLRHRHAWLRYSLCLAELCLPHLKDRICYGVQEVSLTLKLLHARAQGKLEPWEAILLVRPA